MSQMEMRKKYPKEKDAQIIFEKTQSNSIGASDEDDSMTVVRPARSVRTEREGDVSKSGRVVKEVSDVEKSSRTVDAREDEIDHVFDNRRTDWLSMWIAIFMQFIVGLQISVHYMSMWPYLKMMDKEAGMMFFGWIIASCSIGMTLSNPFFGWWSEKAMSIRVPTVTGFGIAAVGQLMYACANLVGNQQKWVLLTSRFITGIGVGNGAALRTYAATASVPKDRMRAISFGTAGFGLGFSIGPVISSLFAPLGPDGYVQGSFFFNMYTAAAFVMVAVSALCAFITLVFFEESYVGIVNEDDKDHVQVIVPKFDKIASIICIYLFMVAAIIATNVEIMSTPLTTVLYDWPDQTSIFYNGIAIFASSAIAVILNIVIGSTRVGNIDKRYQMLFAIGVFMLYQLAMYPWPFYSGPLNYQKDGAEGGCLSDYAWCSTTTRVPIFLFYLSFVVFFGIAFPFIEIPSSVLFSEILGPRKQGTMQGMFSFGGSIAPVIASLSSTALFESYGYGSVILLQAGTLMFGAACILVFYKKLVPLKLQIKRDDDEGTQKE